MTRIISIVGGLQPTAPTIGTATGGDTSASVAFTASSYIGKGTITYTATSSPGGFTATGASSPLTVTGLTNGTAYTFTVVGNTNYGVASVASAASNSVTPAAAGSFYSIATITTTGGQANATFSGIDQSYNHLQVRCMLPSLGDTLELIFNGSSGADYSAQGLYGSGSGSVSAYMTGSAQNNIGIAAGYAQVQSLIVDITNYTSGFNKTARTLQGVDDNGSGNVGLRGGNWYVGDAITSVRFRSQSGSFVAGCKFHLYGIKGA